MNDCCEHELLPFGQIRSRNSGFVKNSESVRKDYFFLVRLDMRLKRDDNESCQISVDGKTATCQVIICSGCCASASSAVQWKLRFVKDTSPWRVATEIIRIEDSEL